MLLENCGDFLFRQAAAQFGLPAFDLGQEVGREFRKNIGALPRWQVLSDGLQVII